VPNPENSSSENHTISLADHILDQGTILVFGKLVNDLQPTSKGERFAQIAGFMRGKVCTRLPKPILMALPEPDGPANECGWNPKAYLMWRIPEEFSGTVLHTQTLPAGQLFLVHAAVGASMNRTQSLTVISKSIIAVTGKVQQFDPSDTLALHGINTDQQMARLRVTITGDPQNGVGQFGFSLNANALIFITTSSTIDALATAIEKAATSNA
jgi:hypothetical protein